MDPTLPVVESYTEAYAPKKVMIGISGIIGSGKTFMTGSLAHSMGFMPIYEPVDTNPYLGMFYKDMERNAFRMQMRLLIHRNILHKQGLHSGKDVIFDRIFLEDAIFAKMMRESGHMEELDFQTYKMLFSEIFCNDLHRPDLIVFLDVEPEEALRRVKMRARDCETKMSVEYLTDLQKAYEEWLADVTPRIPVLRLDWNEFKPIEFVVRKVKEELAKTRKGIII